MVTRVRGVFDDVIVIIIIMLIGSALVARASDVLQAGQRATRYLLGRRVDHSLQSPAELPACLCCPESHTPPRSHFTSRPLSVRGGVNTFEGEKLLSLCTQISPTHEN